MRTPLMIFSFTVALCLSACAGESPRPDDGPTEGTTDGDEDPEPTEAAFRADDVEFDAAGMTVHGTLTRPTDEGAHPGLLLIAGSGPTDRNWNSPLLPGENGSAERLARSLSQRGVVVLRYDKRGTGETGEPEQVTWDDYKAEQEAALSLLKDHEAVDSSRVYIAGHSEGGAHALELVMSEDVDVAGVILLSTAGRGLRDVILWQVENQLKAAGVDQSTIATHQARLADALDKIAEGKLVDPGSASQYPGVQNLIKGLQDPSSVAFARELLVFDPVAALEKIDVPALILSGGKDLQIDPELDAGALKNAASDAGKDVRFAIIPDADHVLKHQEKPRSELTSQDALKYNAPGRELARGVVEAIVTFVELRGDRDAGAATTSP